MKNFVANLRNGLTSVREDDERGDIIQTLLIIVIFVVIVVAVGKKLWPVINGQADKTATTIEDGTNYVVGG